MAAVVHGHNNAVTSNLTSYVSTAFTPAANDLLVVFIRTGETADAGTLTGSVVTTFTKIDHANLNAGVDRVYGFVGDMLTTATSQTVTFACGADPANGCLFQVARVSGMTLLGAAAVRQSAKAENQAGGGTPAATFASAALTTNPTLAAMGNLANPATVTPPASWTERIDSGYGTPTTGGEYASRDSGFTGTTITWGSTSATAFGTLIVELDASTGAVVGIPDVVHSRR